MSFKKNFFLRLFLCIFLCHAALFGEQYGAIEIGGKGVKAYVIEIDNTLTKINYRNALNTAPQSGITEHHLMTPEMIQHVSSDIAILQNMLLHDQNISEQNIFIIASSAIYKIKNRPALETKVKKMTHHSLYFINEKEESTFAFYGSVPKAQWLSASMIDIGGGNTKVAWMDAQNIIDFFEIPLGTVSLTQQADLRDTNTSFEEKCVSVIQNELSTLQKTHTKEALYASGGIFWATAYLKTNGHLESFVRLEKADFEKVVALFSHEERKECSEANAQCFLLGYYGAKNLVAGALLAKETIDTMQFFDQKVYFAKDGAWVIGWLLVHTQ
ncbi:Ppx/GppA phosphatase family protein [Sulfurospirillum diekertiae]|uniref:Ppx/GppA phosphatase N-terminal domain-containing protein n=1 Tax=Sulfurospirillum diekertiae TaxID=1854492 RepID=A0AA92IY65_9BACT|nr:hypothetical protein [Sulfurospirillum diekertiae]QIR75701.1 hypothetical protein FA584_05550 [Sulfurospirillum diekertiae]